jgi:hypothetical protein
MRWGWHHAALGLALAVMLVCIFLSLGSIGARADLVESSGTYDVDYDGFAVLMHLQAGEQAQVDFAFNVTEGGPVDVLVLDESGYEMYRMGLSPTHILSANLNRSAGNGYVTSFVSGQEYYIVTDNTDFPSGGADPSGNVVVSWEMSGQDISIIPDDSEGFILIFLVVIVIFVLVLIVLARSRRAEREPGAYVKGMERKYCPNCGQIVEMYVHKCPKCGHEW